jgi:tetratricopeptide (TPR) repeat protein
VVVLEPLDAASMRELLAGLVPGIPDAVVERVLERADGVPLYAVETVRMLLSEGLVTAEDGVYRPVGDLSELSVPPSLHALIASRLDGLEAADRSLLQAGSVIGKSFSIDAIAAVSGQTVAEVTPRLRDLVRREMLSLEADPRSPEQGQYGFVQGLIREVAYGTLARRDRRRLHLAAARYFETLDDEGIAGALAEHYVSAYRAQPEGPEGDAVAAQARVALRGAAERARSLGSFKQAVRFLEQALEVTTDPDEERQLHAAASDAAMIAGRPDDQMRHAVHALELARAGGDRAQTMAALDGYGLALIIAGQPAEASDLLTAAREEYHDLSETPEYVRLSAQLARTTMLSGNAADALLLVDETLPAAERLGMIPETLNLIVTRGPVLANLGRLREAIVALTGAVEAGSSYQMPEVELRARVNLSYCAAPEDPQLAYRVAREGLVVARRLGMRGPGFYMLGNAADAGLQVGDWDWVLTQLEEALSAGEEDTVAELRLAQIQGMKGADVGAKLEAFAADAAEMTEVQAPATVADARAWVALAQGDFQRALEFAKASTAVGPGPDGSALVPAARAAAWLGDRQALDDAVRQLEELPGRVPAAAAREARAAVAALDGRRGEAQAGFADAIRRYRELGLEFASAMCTLDLVTMLGASDPDARAAADDAAALFERVGARPLQELLATALRAPKTPVARVATERAGAPTLQATSE